MDQLNSLGESLASNKLLKAMKTRRYKKLAIPVFCKIEDAVAQLKLDKLPTIEPMKVNAGNFSQNVTLLLSEGNYTSGTTAILVRDGS